MIMNIMTFLTCAANYMLKEAKHGIVDMIMNYKITC
jgi:hypothetical protein